MNEYIAYFKIAYLRPQSNILKNYKKGENLKIFVTPNFFVEYVFLPKRHFRYVPASRVLSKY